MLVYRIRQLPVSASELIVYVVWCDDDGIDEGVEKGEEEARGQVLKGANVLDD